MSQIITPPLNTLTAEELKNIIPYITPDKYTTGDLSSNSHRIVQLLSSLNAKTTYKLMRKIDNQYPGLSFHYVMEARHDLTKQNALFLFRIAYYMVVCPHKELFQPMRTRLIHGLLFDSSDTSSDPKHFNLKSHLESIRDTFVSIDNLSSSLLDKKDLKKIKSKIFEKSFNLYFNKLSDEYGDY